MATNIKAISSIFSLVMRKNKIEREKHTTLQAFLFLFFCRLYLNDIEPHSAAAIKDKANNTITDDESRLARWKEHFEEVLNRDAPVHPITIDTTDRRHQNRTVALGIKMLKNGKSGGIANIVAELLKAERCQPKNCIMMILSESYSDNRKE